MKILVADDDKFILDLITLYLTKMGHQVIAVLNGKLAIEMFNKKRPDLIILDIIMPELDGFECAKKIREIEDEVWIPIIFLCTRIDDYSMSQIINTGGDDYITKPINKVLLEAKIKSMQHVADIRNQLYETTKKLHRLSITDALTGAYNRSELNKIIKKCIQDANQTNSLLALFLLDLDNFKSINNDFGYYVGDLLLKEVANRLQSSLQPNEFLARMGGDEFAIVLHVNSPNEIEHIANKIMAILADSYHLEGNQVYMTACFGIACYPTSGTDEKTLIQNADIAMYQAKALGRNNYQYYSEAMLEINRFQAEMESMLNKAIKNNEFFMIYQPIFNLKTMEIVGMEALIRWLHPSKGIILPDIFIPIAEETDLINRIGEWVFEHVCMQFKKWVTAGYDQLTCTINVSPRQLLQKNFPETVRKIIDDNQLEPRQFEIEITETLLMRHLTFSEKIINKIHKTGIHISVDDFGTGYSSFTHLKKFPISTIKIDKSFVYDITVTPIDAIIVGALIALGKKLNLRVIAEGIENKKQLNFLVKNDCPFGQGYVLSKPLSAKEMTKLLGRAKLGKIE